MSTDDDTDLIRGRVAPTASASAPRRPRMPAAHAAAAPAHAPQPARGVRGSRLRDPRTWLVGYLIALAAIAFWPVPVDSGAGDLLRAITRHFPILTYDRIEFAANIALFLPLGFLVARILTARRHLVVPIALLASLAIESVQSVALGARTSSVLDIVANTAGACAGLIVAEVLDAVRRRSR